MEKYLLVCDWGTSSFRLGLYNPATGVLVDEVVTADGIAGVYREWQTASNDNKAISREDFFRSILKLHIATLSGRASSSLSNTAIIISGMASSSIGMTTISYAGLPFPLDGSGVESKRFEATENFAHEIILISGVQSGTDVIRGEETQLIGVWNELAKKNQPAKAIFIFPGTHSKHIYIQDEQMVSFKSFMTGEIFQVIGSHSILKDSIQLQTEESFSADQMDAFRQGVQQSGQSGLLNTLFTVRTNQLFNRFNKIQNAYYLSGLLIGSELQDLVQQTKHPLILCSGKKLYPFYRMAMEDLSLDDRTHFVSPETVEKTAMAGQRIIYEYFKK